MRSLALPPSECVSVFVGATTTETGCAYVVVIIIVIIITYHQIEPPEPEVLFKSDDSLKVVIIEEEYLEILELVKVLQHVNILSTQMQLQAMLHILVIPPFPNNLLQRSRHNLTRAARFLHFVHTNHNTNTTHTIHTYAF